MAVGGEGETDQVCCSSNLLCHQGESRILENRLGRLGDTLFSLWVDPKRRRMR